MQSESRAQRDAFECCGMHQSCANPVQACQLEFLQGMLPRLAHSLAYLWPCVQVSEWVSLADDITNPATVWGPNLFGVPLSAAAPQAEGNSSSSTTIVHVTGTSPNGLDTWLDLGMMSPVVRSNRQVRCGPFCIRSMFAIKALPLRLTAVQAYPQHAAKPNPVQTVGVRCMCCM